MKKAHKEMSSDDLHSSLQEAVSSELQTAGKKDASPYVHTVFPLANEFVYHDGNDLLRRSYSLKEEGGVKLDGEPVKVARKTVYEPLQVTMAVFSSGDDFVELRGEIFEEGDYPDKGVSYTAQDLQEIATNTGVAPLMIEHAPCPLDEAFTGSGLSGVEAREVEGKTKLFGVVRIPTMLDNLLTKAMGEQPRKVSVRISGNKITEVSLVRNPRISTAAVSAAYSTFAASCGHDGLAPAPDAPAKETKKMPSPLKERIKALFGKTDPAALKEAGIDPAEIDGVEFSEAKQEKPAETAPIIDTAARAEIEQLKAANFSLVKGKVEDAAVAFAKDAIEAKKFFPSDKDLLISNYRNALSVDSKGSFTFSVTGAIVEGAEVEKLRKSVADRPAMNLTSAMAGGVLILEDKTFSEEDKTKNSREAYFGNNDPAKAEEKK